MLDTGSQVILYGAGGRAKLSFNVIREQGGVPVCFCDGDKTKQNTRLRVWGTEELDIISPQEASSRYPNALVYITPAVPGRFSIMEYAVSNELFEKDG